MGRWRPPAEGSTALITRFQITRDGLWRESPDGSTVKTPTRHPPLERHELEGAIEASVSALAPPRNAVVRLYLAGSDRVEIAELLGWSELKVRNLLYRGLRDLRVVLAARGMTPGILARARDHARYSIAA